MNLTSAANDQVLRGSDAFVRLAMNICFAHLNFAKKLAIGSYRQLVSDEFPIQRSIDHGFARDLEATAGCDTFPDKDVAFLIAFFVHMSLFKLLWLRVVFVQQKSCWGNQRLFR